MKFRTLKEWIDVIPNEYFVTVTYFCDTRSNAFPIEEWRRIVSNNDETEVIAVFVNYSNKTIKLRTNVGSTNFKTYSDEFELFEFQNMLDLYDTLNTYNTLYNKKYRQPYLTKLEELMITRQSLVKANIITEKESEDILKLLDNIYRIVLKK